MTGRLECFIENLFSIWKTATGKMYPMSVLVLKVGYMISGSQCWYLKSPKQTPTPKGFLPYFDIPAPHICTHPRQRLLLSYQEETKQPRQAYPLHEFSPVLESWSDIYTGSTSWLIVTLSTPDASGAVYSGAIYYIYFFLPSQMSFCPPKTTNVSAIKIVQHFYIYIFFFY